MDLKQKEYMHQVPPVHDHRLKKLYPHNCHRPGANNEKIYRNNQLRHTLQPISHQGHEAAHTISVNIVKLGLWIFLSVQNADK
jgi:hypothetical protein